MSIKLLDFENGLSFRLHQAGFSYKTSYFLSRGRDALNIICTQIKRYYSSMPVFLPSFICSIVPQVFSKNGIYVSFYDISDNLALDMQNLRAAGYNGRAIVFYVNYFGINQSYDIIGQLCNDGSLVIEDNSQAGLNNSIIGQINGTGWSFSSLRKLLPVPDGAMLSFFNLPRTIPDRLKNPSVQWLFVRTMGIVFKSLSLVLPNRYLDAVRQEFFTAAVKKINFPAPAKMSRLSRRILNHIDLECVCKRRKQNYAYLLEHLSGVTPVITRELNAEECPFGLPVYAENRDALQQHLASHKINAAVLWEKKQVSANGNNSNANAIAEKILVLPVGQSYTEKDMERIALCLNKEN